MIFSALAAHPGATGSASRAAGRDPVAGSAPPLHNPPPMSPRSLSTARAGFTVVELMVTIAILAILLGIAAPSLRDFVLNTRLTGQANDLLGDLMLARSEAVKRDLPVSLCGKKNNGDTACGEDPKWGGGWFVVVDTNGNGKMDDGALPMKAGDTLGGGNTLINNAPGSSKGAVTFSPTGTASSGATTLTICDERGQGRLVSLNKLGQASVSKINSGCK